MNAELTIIELRPGLWMVKEPGSDGGPGVIRGYLSAVSAPDGIRYCARLPHLNPTQGPSIGEYWEWERAIDAIVAEKPRPIEIDPYRDLHYSDPAERAKRLEERRKRRRFSGRLVE